MSIHLRLLRAGRRVLRGRSSSPVPHARHPLHNRSIIKGVRRLRSNIPVTRGSRHNL